MKKIFGIILAFVIMFGVFNIVSAQSSADKTTYGDDLSQKRECLTKLGRGCFNYEDYVFLGSSHSRKTENKTVLTVAQDAVLAATYMVGTVLTLVIIYCGVMFIFASSGGKDTTKYKNGLIKAGVGALLVWSAYTIVRLIQYIARP